MSFKKIPDFSLHDDLQGCYGRGQLRERFGQAVLWWICSSFPVLHFSVTKKKSFKDACDTFGHEVTIFLAQLQVN